MISVGVRTGGVCGAHHVGGCRYTMAVDTPATIAVLGAGPMGIETGLYARYLGYSVAIFEQREVASHVLARGHLRMCSPFIELRSSLGLAALRAQDAEYRPPESDAQLTGAQWVDKYLLPLSRTDLLADEIHCHVRVVAVGRQHPVKHEPSSDEHRGDDGFRVLVEHANGRQTHALAEIVIDCTGVYEHPNGCGAGDIPAQGERQVRDRIEHIVPDQDEQFVVRFGNHVSPERLFTTEPNFYILGAKSLGRHSRFLMADGFRQIRDLFGVIGGRPGLDLYATAEKLTK
jgi:hypothetical protein